MARLLASFLVVILVPAVALGSTAYRCQLDGIVRSACCCKGGESDGRQSEPRPTIQTTSCCDVVVTEAPDSVPARVDAHFNQLDLPIATLLPVASLIPPRSQPRLRPEWPRGPPGPARPLFIQHCSLLI